MFCYNVLKKKMILNIKIALCDLQQPLSKLSHINEWAKGDLAKIPKRRSFFKFM